MYFSKIKTFCILVILAGITGGFGLVARADTLDPSQENPFTYVLYLVKQNNSLILDPTRQPAHQLVAKEFVQPLTGLRPWRGQVVSRVGSPLATFLFDVPGANGAFTIQAPYLPNAYTINLANDQGQAALVVDVSTRAVCNEDSICDSTGGENDRNCAADCRVRLTSPPSPSISSTPTPTSGGRSIWSSLLLLAIGIGLAALYWWYRRRTQSIGPTGS